MKRGFTLIELLAVIVILAIIVLIAVPIVVNIINDSKKESLQRSIDLYIDHVQKVVAKEQMTNPTYNPDRCEIQSNGNIKCYKGETVLKTTKGNYELEIEMNGKKPTEGEITFNNNKISYDNVLLESTYYHMNIEGKKETSKEKKIEEPEVATISETEDYRGYYADVDGDGIVDGVIYADLAHDSDEEAIWMGDRYSYTAKTNLKKYTISKNTYKKNDGFGTKPIISIKSGSSGNARFYVMALEDFKEGSFEAGNSQGSPEGTYYWYKNASGKMDTWETDTSKNFGTGYTNTGKIIEIWNKNGEGIGSYEGATQDDYDIWKHIQTKYQQGWFIPSSGEWGAFGYYLYNREENPITTSNYISEYEFSNYYWSSTQTSNGGARPFGIFLLDHDVYFNYYVRLSITF